MRLVVLQHVADTFSNQCHGGFDNSNGSKLHNVHHFLNDFQSFLTEGQMFIHE